MPKILIFTLSLLVYNLPSFAQNTRLNMDDFLRDAVMNGLKKDKLTLQQVMLILDKESLLFVAKCPICTPIKASFGRYQNIVKKRGKSKLPKNILIGLASTDKSANQEAFKLLIERYIQQAFSTMKWTEEQQKDLQNQLASGRKQGMSYKNDSFGKFCPSCDGACGVK